jgi:MarR family transcriptional regulator, organic hydroperoxide resistance regulator
MPAEHKLPPQLTVDEHILALVAQLAKRCATYVDHHVSRHQLTRAQAMLLRTLDSPLPMRQVAVRLDCDASNVTGIVDRLEARGLIQRVSDAADRRVKYLTLTHEGKRVRDSLAAVAPSFPGLGVLSETEKRRLQQLLVRIVAAMEA